MGWGVRGAWAGKNLGVFTCANRGRRGRMHKCTNRLLPLHPFPRAVPTPHEKVLPVNLHLLWRGGARARVRSTLFTSKPCFLAPSKRLGPAPEDCTFLVVPRIPASALPLVREIGVLAHVHMKISRGDTRLAEKSRLKHAFRSPSCCFSSPVPTDTPSIPVSAAYASVSSPTASTTPS
jgi:hypothetical protein